MVEKYIQTLKNTNQFITEFDAELWNLSVEKVIVNSDGSLKFYFKF